MQTRRTRKAYYVKIRTYDESNTSEFVYTGIVSDKVTSTSNDGVGMWFVWIVDDTATKLGYSVAYPYQDWNEPIEGNWIIEAYEADTSADIAINNNWITFKSGLLKSSSTSFTVSPLPEFSFGSLISMFLAGAIYLMIRRNLNGSINANR